MGVQGLWKLLECTGRPVNPETLEGKILAVDISIWLNQAVKGARDRQGNAVQNAHLLTLFHRLCKLLFFRIRPIFVFDGEAPGLKKRTLAIRRQRKNAAAHDSTKTTDKLLKTFLKRQAIKAVLTGKSDDAVPSLSRVRREEVDDIYLLPDLEEQEKHSSDEEEEKEWEERMTQRQLLQEEFFEDPHAVDIESEDFISLPPEVKHEILTDLRELTMRRRTMIEKMPEESDDFSQYQLKGLLKKNTLNQHIKTVQKEMNQQCSGDIQALYENEGGFLKNAESRRVMSEDTSHYILIKGIKAKKEAEQENRSVTSSSTMVTRPVCSEVADGTSADSHSPSLMKLDPEDSAAVVAPPSPRTLMAIEVAMLECSSEEEAEGEKKPLPVVHYKTVPVTVDMPHVPTGSEEGNMSPRTLLAIQQALNEDDNDIAGTPRPILTTVSDEKQVNPDTKVLLISSSDEDDVVPEIKAAEEPTLTSSSTHTQSVELDQKSPELEKNIMVYSENCTANIPDNCTVAVHTVEIEGIESKQRCSFDIERHTFPHRKANEMADGEDIRRPKTFPLHADSLDSSDLETAMRSKTGGNDDILRSISQMEETSLPNDCIPAIPGGRMNAEEPVDDEAIPSKESDSESDESFIEVDSDQSDHPGDQGEPVEVLLPAPETTVTHPLVEAAPTVDQEIAGREVDNPMGDGAEERVLPVRQEAGAAEGREAAINEWHDISLEELETLESNLLVQQGTLQAQRQQQERIAATVTGQMCLESQELLRLFGVPYIVAPTEAEAQCAILDLTDQTSGTITDDSDIWLFGARHVYKNFFSQNKYVEYYQYVDIHNQLGLDRNKLINLAYLLGSDYTDGIPTVGCVTAMEILNEFPGHGLEPLIQFRDWWNEAQKNKKIRDNPNDTKVKKKLRGLELHQAFPNLAVAEAYLKPVVDDCKGAFSWGRPDLEQIREFCETAFGWYRSKTDEVLLPVLKQLNAQQTQLRIDSFFRLEQHEKRVIKSQRMRRAVTCMQRKEKEGDILEVEEATAAIEQEFKSPRKRKGKRVLQDTTTGLKCETGKRNKATNSQPENLVGQVGGFLDVGHIPKSVNSSSSGESEAESANRSTSKQTLEEHKMSNVCQKAIISQKCKNGGDGNSSSSDEDEEEEKTVMVTARSVFKKKVGTSRNVRGRKKKN